MAAIVDDDPLDLEHVEDDPTMPGDNAGPVVDIEDKQEFHVKPLHTYYCHCGQVSFTFSLRLIIYFQLSLISDTALNRLPLRERDGARVIDPNRTVAKMTAVPGDIIYIRRYFFIIVKAKGN